MAKKISKKIRAKEIISKKVNEQPDPMLRGKKATNVPKDVRRKYWEELPNRSPFHPPI